MPARERLQRAEREAAVAARTAVPALITGGAGDDRAGVVTYTVVGATTGFSQLWLLLLSTPLLVAATAMAARVALATRQGLAAVIERRYTRALSVWIVLLLAIPNIATISADVAGVASALAMFTGVRWELFVPVVVAVLAVLLHRGYARIQRALTLFTLALVAYAAAAFAAHPDWARVVRATLVPTVIAERSWALAALALLGTTISPYMLFWQANEEVEELRAGFAIRARAADAAIWIGMLFSNLIAFFIIVAAAAAIPGSGAGIDSVADVARALQPLHEVGAAAFIIGIIAAGLLALPVVAGSTVYAVAEVFGWNEGLGAAAGTARGSNLVLGIALLGGAASRCCPSSIRPPRCSTRRC